MSVHLLMYVKVRVASYTSSTNTLLFIKILSEEAYNRVEWLLILDIVSTLGFESHLLKLRSLYSPV